MIISPHLLDDEPYLDEPAKSDANGASEPLRPLDSNALATLEIPAQEMMLAPWLATQSLSMVHAYRGIGKTFFCLEIALGVSRGTRAIRWDAPKARRVLYIDGEMPLALLQERQAMLANGDMPTSGGLTFLAQGYQRRSMPDLATTIGQIDISQLVSDIGAELVIVDNLSCLAYGEGSENEAESWSPVQDWAIRMRSEGRSVLFVHHSGKSGAQRGTSKREDILDTVITLRTPTGVVSSDGACFDVVFEKCRAIHGKDADSFETKLIQIDGNYEWTSRTTTEGKRNRVLELAEREPELSGREIAKQLDLPQKSVSRWLKKAEANGQEGIKDDLW